MDLKFVPTTASADLPHMQILEIGEDYVLGVERNADGVEFVVQYDITQGAPPAAAP